MKRKKSDYEILQSKRAIELLRMHTVFNSDLGGKLFPTNEGLKPKKDYLLSAKNNIQRNIWEDVIDYFNKNEIHFWKTGFVDIDEPNMPTGHTLSSQVSCINHLFPFRKDQNAVEAIFGVIDVEKIDDGYIAFEYTNRNILYLNESCDTRGTNCTSIDAFVKANGVGIGIEWKYTETDYDTTKAQPYWEQRYRDRYRPLLKGSNIIENDALISCQMHYELMRQTLLLEQMKNHNDISDYINIVVCPKENIELFECCQNWKAFLKNPKKFMVIDPKELLRSIHVEKYNDVKVYLEKRYW